MDNVDALALRMDELEAQVAELEHRVSSVESSLERVFGPFSDLSLEPLSDQVADLAGKVDALIGRVRRLERGR